MDRAPGDGGGPPRQSGSCWPHFCHCTPHRSFLIHIMHQPYEHSVVRCPGFGPVVGRGKLRSASVFLVHCSGCLSPTSIKLFGALATAMLWVGDSFVRRYYLGASVWVSCWGVANVTLQVTFSPILHACFPSVVMGNRGRHSASVVRPLPQALSDMPPPPIS